MTASFKNHRFQPWKFSLRKYGLLSLVCVLSNCLLISCGKKKPDSESSATTGNQNANVTAANTTASKTNRVAVDTVFSETPETTSVSPLSDELKPGDFIFIKLVGVPKPEQRSEEARLDDNGLIQLLHLSPISAAGLTPSELAAEIERQYIANRIYVSPQVTVSLSKRYVQVIGEVRSPQRVYHRNDLTLLSAISAAGGFTDFANTREVRLVRNGKSLLFNADAALENSKLDVPLQIGDLIEVRRRFVP